MTRFGLLFRTLLLAIIFGLPVAAIGWFLGGFLSAAAAIGALILLALYVGLFSERKIVRRFKASDQLPLGFERSVREVKNSLNGWSGRVLVNQDMVPFALSCRGFGTAGTIIVSLGLVSQLREQELRQVIRAAAHRAMAPGMVLATFTSVIAMWILFFAPKRWVDLTLVPGGKFRYPAAGSNLDPLSAMAFLLVWPFFRVVMYLGSQVKGVRVPPDFGLNFAPLARSALTDRGARLQPALSHLYFSLS